MMRSMFAGVSGLRANQTMMDVVGNNIANVNTTGFKASQVTFQEALSQTLRGAAGSTATGRGGTNPIQIGLGTIVASVDDIFTQGAAQTTGRNTDLSLQGDGFFMVSNGGGDRNYTRAGSFNFDEDGYLVNPDGLKVQGWTADAVGNIDSNSSVGNIKLPIGQVVDPIPTTQISVGGNLSSDAANGTVVSTTINTYDSVGAAHLLRLDYTKTGTNAWSLAATLDGATVDLDGATAGTTAAMTFNANGAADERRRHRPADRHHRRPADEPGARHDGRRPDGAVRRLVDGPGLLAERRGDRVPPELRHRQRRHDHRAVLERRHQGAGPGRHRHLQQPHRSDPGRQLELRRPA